MFADAVELLALMLAAGWLGLVVFAIRGRRRGRDVRGALLLAAAVAVALFGVQAALSDAIDDAGGGATRVDAAAAAFAVAHRTPVLTAVAETLNVAGSLAGLAVVAAAVAVTLLLRGRRIEAALAAGAPAAAGLLGNGSKLGYDRARPPVAAHLVTVSESSLPSGHTLDATIVLGVLALVVVSLLRGRLARTAVVAAACAAIAVAGAARVYLGVHWMTDVVAGWLLGGAWVAFSAAVLLMLTRPHGSRPVESRGVRPGPAPGRRPAAVEHLRAPRCRPGATDDDRTGRLAS
jgi:membrane-associated phospholipid phosphatase